MSALRELSAYVGAILLVALVVVAVGLLAGCEPNGAKTRRAPDPGPQPSKLHCVVEYGKTYCNRTD